MRKKLTKILALLVTMVIAMSVMCVPAFAAQTVTYWNHSDMYQIADSTNSAHSEYAYYLPETHAATAQEGGVGSALTLAEFKTIYTTTGNDNRSMLTFEGKSDIFKEGKSSTAVENFITGIKAYTAGGVKNVVIRKSSNGTENYRRTPWIVATGTPSSGDEVASIRSTGKGSGDVQTFTFEEYGAGRGVVNNDKVIAVGFMINTTDLVSNAGDFSVTANFECNGISIGSKTLSRAALSETDWDDGETTYISRTFYGFKAPEGAYISSIVANIPSGTWPSLDDFGYVTKEYSADDATTTVTVSGNENIEQPAYGATATYTFTAESKNAAENVITYDSYTWSLAESATGASINEETGVLSITRDFDTTKPIKVIATSKINTSAKGELTVSVAAVAPYYRTNMVVKSNTEYTREDFVEDLSYADNIAVLNFEKGTFTESGATVTVPVSGTNASIKISRNGTRTASGNTTTQTGFRIGEAANAASGTGVSTSRNGDNCNITFDSSSLDNLEPTAIGWAINKTGGGALTHRVTLTYSDGTTEELADEKVVIMDMATDEYAFLGFKAPKGTYITNVNMTTNSFASIDDICVILEDPADTTPVFSKDAKAYKVIREFSDVSDAESIYVAFPKDAQATGKLILAIYDNYGLLDVNLVDQSTGSASVSVPSGKTVQEVKMFIWDSVDDLNPLNGKMVIIQ